MIRGVFPRLFGSFKEGAFVSQKFIFTTAGAGAVIAYRNKVAGASANVAQAATAAQAQQGQLHLARTNVGLYTLTLVGGARDIVCAEAKVLNKTAVVANNRRVEVNNQVESTGAISLQIVDNAGAAADLVTNNDELHVIVYCDK